MERTNFKIWMLFVSTAVCFGSSYGGLIPDEPINSGNIGYKMAIIPDEDRVPSARISNPFGFLQQKLSVPRNIQSTSDALVTFSEAFAELKHQLKGFAPYVSKLAKPIIRAVAQILEKGHTYFVEYVRSLSPETVKNVQTTLLDFLGKLINIDIVKAFLQLAVRGSL